MGSYLGASLASQTQNVGFACKTTTSRSTHFPIPQHVHEAVSLPRQTQRYAVDRRFAVTGTGGPVTPILGPGAPPDSFHVTMRVRAH